MASSVVDSWFEAALCDLLEEPPRLLLAEVAYNTGTVWPLELLRADLLVLW